MTDKNDQQYVNRMVEEHGIPDGFFLALGWAVGQCCAMLDRGEDPRRAGIPGFITKAVRDIYDTEKGG